MTDTLIPNGQLIVFNFPAGAGGKMLQNCVGLSRYCVLNRADYIHRQLCYPGPISEYFYLQKLNWILETVPEPEKMGDWLAYEIDKDNPIGFNFMGFKQKLPITNQDYYKLAQQGLWCTITTHNYDSSEYFNAYWPTVRHVSLVNNEQFAKKALAIKNTHLEFDQDWATLGCTPPDRCFNFDIDGTIYNHDRFVNQVQDLYRYLEFDDFQSDLISKYYKTYIAIH